MIFGRNIKRLRNKLKLSQDQFSEKIDIAPTTLSVIESGKAFTTSETINKICKVFNINAFYLFEPNSEYIKTEYNNRKDAVNDLIFMLNTLDDSKIELTANFIKMLSDSNIDIKYKKGQE